jgi:hypothetical protein
LSAEQASRAGRSAIGYFHATRHNGLRSEVANLSLVARTSLPSRAIAFRAKLPEPERDIHREQP